MKRNVLGTGGMSLFLACLIWGLWNGFASAVWADPGLLIVAHGAPRAQWNTPVLELGRSVAEQAARDGAFRAVRTAMLEFAQPDVARAVKELEAEGCRRIIAVPLFIAPSGHTLFDVPAVLGIYSSSEMRAMLLEEGAEIAHPKVPITLTQTLDCEVLCAFALDQVRRLSQEPKDEALILLAHGSADHYRLVDGLVRRIAAYCCGQAGIDYGDWAFVKVGQDYAEEGARAIERAARHKKRVLVVGLYVASSAWDIHRRATTRGPQGLENLLRLEQQGRVVFSKQGLIAHPATARWILDVARGALEPTKGRKEP